MNKYKQRTAMRLLHKTAVVTGAAGGIGQAIIRKLLAEGARVVAADLSIDALKVFNDVPSDKLATFSVDVTDYSQVEAMVKQAAKQFGQLDILINNAGIGLAKPLLQHDPINDFEPVTNVNQKGVYHGILAGGRQFQAQGTRGVILNTSSVYAQLASEMTFTYNVSKAAVDMMTKCAALEYAPRWSMRRVGVCAAWCAGLRRGAGPRRYAYAAPIRSARAVGTHSQRTNAPRIYPTE